MLWTAPSPFTATNNPIPIDDNDNDKDDDDDDHYKDLLSRVKLISHLLLFKFII